VGPGKGVFIIENKKIVFYLFWHVSRASQRGKSKKKVKRLRSVPWFFILGKHPQRAGAVGMVGDMRKDGT
jgi:hypothetical protein